MPVSPTYPGVYIEEVPSGVRTITGVATAITAFIGRAIRGEVNKPVRIQSFGDYDRAFGDLSLDSPMAYSVQHFFQNGGTDAIIVRVYRAPSQEQVTAGAAADGVANLSLIGAGVAAQGTLTVATNPSNGDTMTIDSKVYTFDDDTPAVAAQGTLTIATNPSDGDTMTIATKEYTFDDADAVAAQGTLTIANNPSDGDTMTIGSKDYTFQDTLVDADGNIQRGGSVAATRANIVAAINLSGTAGTDYAAQMEIHPTVAAAAAFDGNQLVLTAKTPGTVGNSIATDGNFTAGGNIFDGDTLGTTTPGAETGLTDADGHIAIGADVAASRANIVAAINLTGTAGTEYAAQMEIHPTVAAAAAFVGDQLELTAKTPGTAGNSIDTTEDFTADGNIFDGATLGTTTAGADAGLTDADGHIAIGADVAASRANIVAAINLSGTAGADYAPQMTVHPTVAAAAAFVGDQLVLTANTVGTSGNSIATTETFAADGNIFDGATLGTTTAGADPLPSPSLVLAAANPGAWANHLRVTVDHAIRDPLDTNAFNLTFEEIDPALPVTAPPIRSEKFFNVSVDPASPLFVDKVLESRSMLVRVRARSSERPGAATRSSFAGGSDGRDITDAEISDSGLEADKQGLWALEDADLFNLLCIPPLTLDTDIGSTTRDAALKYCKDRRAFYILDPPSSWVSVTAAESGVDELNLRDENVGVYFPRVRMVDPLRDNQLSTFVPSGVIAGIYARTDARRGVWKAPAGIEATMSRVRELAIPLTDGENGRLNPLGVNCLRTFPVVGNLVWGSRTLEGADQLASEWKYVPVRRTALYIEESLYRGLQWVVFEPNDEPLWAQIRLNVGSFMHTLFRQGAFQGASPNEAYLVKCDKETTTQADIDRGVVNIIVGFAPLEPAEFVFVKIQQLAGQLQT